MENIVTTFRQLTFKEKMLLGAGVVAGVIVTRHHYKRQGEEIVGNINHLLAQAFLKGELVATNGNEKHMRLTTK